jgi:hypothetical protein
MYIFLNLDATIANLSSVIFILQDFTAHNCFSQPMNLNSKLKFTLKNAYNLFVNKIANLERGSNTQIGILRPGILDFFKFVKNLKDDGKCEGVVIYSNNTSLQCLNFIRDVIHECLFTINLIDDCVHKFHKFRGKTSEDYHKFGIYAKTWSTLKNLLMYGNLKVSKPIDPSSVLFFDNYLHINLKQILLDNYIIVQPYKYSTPWRTIEKLYIDVIEETQIEIDEFLNFINKFTEKSNSNIYTHLHNYKMRYYVITNGETFVDCPKPDSSLNLMMNSLKFKFQ